jgi:hypothetical protein
MVKAFAEVIGAVLANGWTCVWSYADSGAIAAIDAVEAVTKTNQCTVFSFATPFVHKAQGGTHQKRVTEYVIVFRPEQRGKV